MNYLVLVLSLIGLAYASNLDNFFASALLMAFSTTIFIISLNVIFAPNSKKPDDSDSDDF